ncbi:uncharacterized protein TM35_000421040 [Trypanosoma theileri]|uniref:UBX domain-containing protein n=1 Tax=Trypanosoma theileri TaxID=67003 RepID=A0A1X0NIZ7_9TRYP|nr:uncharacterized protein TM35_000421040 [Trypanosoma theileri]ORC84646.1 hypothetical protein TM35_000421040 [Trypanosoma theileri]
MLRLCENVEEALGLSKRWQIPLLIFVHSSLPESATHTDTANESADPALSGLFTAKNHGKKTVNANFNIGSESLAHNGAAQRHAFEVVLQESRLSSVTVVHFMDAASSAHELFIAAVPESSQVVPRLHVFPASQQMLPRNVLHGGTLTPGYISEAVRFVLRMPPLTKVTELMGEFVQHVEEVNTVVRQTTAAAAGSYGSHILPSTRPTARGGDATVSSDTPQTGSVAAAALPAVDRKDLHFIALNGLEKREVIVTSPGMTLRTVWMKVQQALMRRREASDAGVEMRPRSGISFVLRVEPPTTAENTNNEGVVVLSSIEEASKMDIHKLPHNTVVTVVQNDSPAGHTPPPPATTTTTTTQPGGTKSGNPSVQVNEEESSKKSQGAAGVQCEGGVCKVPLPTSTKTVKSERKQEEEEKQQQQQQPVSSPPASTSAMMENEEETRKPTATTTASSSSSVNIRCSLPDGNTHTVAALDPTVATLATDVRPEIAPLVGNASFVMACAYPPHRFTAEEETETLEKIGLRTSCALRVVLTGGASSSTASVPRHVDAASFGLMNLVSSLLGRGTAPRPTAPAPANMNVNANPTGSNTAATRSGGRFRTMAELRAAEEEEENRREARNEQQRRKANRYYGGGSTEYTGKNDDDNEEHNEDKEEEEKGKKEDDKYAKKNA